MTGNRTFRGTRMILRSEKGVFAHTSFESLLVRPTLYFCGQHRYMRNSRVPDDEREMGEVAKDLDFSGKKFVVADEESNAKDRKEAKRGASERAAISEHDGTWLVFFQPGPVMLGNCSSFRA